MDKITQFFQALYDAIIGIFDDNVDGDGEKRDIFDKIKAAFDALFGIA